MDVLKKQTNILMIAAVCSIFNMQGAEAAASTTASTTASMWSVLSQNVSSAIQKFKELPEFVQGGIYFAGGVAVGALGITLTKNVLISQDDQKDPADVFCDIAQNPSEFWFAEQRIIRARSRIDVDNLTDGQRERLAQLKDSLHDTFGFARGKTYGGLICLNEEDSYKGTFACERALLITGGRVVTLDPEGGRLQFLVTTYTSNVQREVFELLYELEHIQLSGGFAYRPEGERNYIYLMLSYATGIGEGWLGYFLGYAPYDVEFFHQRMALSTDLPGVYSTFSEAQRHEFEAFKVDVWPRSLAGVIFEVDKVCMKRWLEKQKNFCNEELMHYLNDLRSTKNGNFGDRYDLIVKKRTFKNRLNAVSEEQRNEIIRTTVESRACGFVSLCLASNNVDPDMKINGKPLFDWCVEIESEDYAPLIRTCYERGLMRRLYRNLISKGDSEVANVVACLLDWDEQGNVAASSSGIMN